MVEQARVSCNALSISTRPSPDLRVPGRPARGRERKWNTSRKDCPYCARFGRRAQRCGHNPQIQPKPRTVSWDVIVGIDLLTTHGAYIDVQRKAVSFTSAKKIESCTQVEIAVESSEAADANKNSQEKRPVGRNHLVPSTQMQSNWFDILLTRSQVTPDQRTSLIPILSEYADVFDVNCAAPGRTNWLQHSIDTSSHRPIRQSCRRVPIHQQAQLDKC
ncbi:unnamed protein product [Echinostoma caproni]|uniref:Uncharacterized protein n=1 Tax=Echinostoma caproni TaxID=27848 RepID=A0A183BFJ0_9TREM|nr:unnamed protein product [Echinostoma caproni]